MAILGFLNFFRFGVLSFLFFTTKFIIVYCLFSDLNFPFCLRIISILRLFCHVIICFEFHMYNFPHTPGILFTFFALLWIIISIRFSYAFKLSLLVTGSDFSKVLHFLLSCSPGSYWNLVHFSWYPVCLLGYL